MRALLGNSSPVGLVKAGLLCFAVTLVRCQDDDLGYYAEESFDEDAIDVVDLSACPTDRLLRTRETCIEDGASIQCIRLRCCDTHVFVSGRCIPKSVDPCSLQLCEQKCQVKQERIWCSCHPGYTFDKNNYLRKYQPFCLDVNECENNNGGCQQRCVNDPGGYHCECDAPLVIARDGKRCDPPVVLPLAIPVSAPMALTRASSRCYAPCDSVSWLSRKVRQLTDQLATTQSALKKLMEHPAFKADGDEKFAEGNFVHRVLDSTAPLVGGYCRCERGPRGPAGPPGVEGPKGDVGARGPRGARGPQGALDLMLLLLADIRHDVKNLETKVYAKDEEPVRFNLDKAWRRQRKQEKMEQESRVAQELEGYAPPAFTDGSVDISPNGRSGEIPHEDQTTTDFTMIKGETDPPEDIISSTPASASMDDLLRMVRLIASSTAGDDDEENDGLDYDYNS